MTNLNAPTATESKRSNKSKWLVIIAAIVAAVLIVVMLINSFGGTSAVAPAEADGTGDSLSEETRQMIIDSLTVTTTSPDAQCVTDEYDLVPYQIGALESIPPRKWSDALSTPMSATDPQKVRDELQQTICEDPLLGVSYLTFLATDVRDQLLKSTDVDILELNEWLEEFDIDPLDDINAKAAEFTPLLDATDPSAEEIDAAMAKNRDWQKLASYANTLLDRFVVTGIEARKSTVNYHLAAGGLVVGTLPAVERNDKQEDLDALILTLTEKDQCEEILVIGANMHDKRPELFVPNDCKPKTPTPTTPPTTTPPTTPPHTPPPSGCVNNCEPTNPPCTVNCDAKDPADNVEPPAGTDPQPVEGSPAPPSPAPSIPLDPTTPPGTDTGEDVPGGGATPAPETSSPPPATDEKVAPEPEDPGTEIGEPAD